MENKKMEIRTSSLSRLKYAKAGEAVADRLFNRGNVKVIQDNLNLYSKKMIKNYLFLNTIHERLPVKQFMNSLEKDLIDEVLSMTRGNQKDAALILDIKESTLCEKIKKYKIQKHQTNLLYLLDK